MKQTPLYEAHIKAGAKMVDFHGWALPVQYSGIIEEHERVRSAAGLFDVSHMGEIEVIGSGAGQFLQRLVTNDISAAKDGQAVYTPMCYPDGGTVDDLLVYRWDAESYLLVVNASNTEKDLEWLKDNLNRSPGRTFKQDSGGGVRVTNVSDCYAQLALQGPKAQDILQKLTRTDLNKIRFYHFLESVKVGGIEAAVSRSGYTGEDGFELYAAPDQVAGLWEALLEAGAEDGLIPVGLGARDTLRFEAALPLYGQELSEDISPLEAGLGRFIRLDKEDFIGRQALLEQQSRGLPRALVGFEMVDRGIPRSHYEVQVEGRKVGWVTSGGFAPSLKRNLGMALVDAEHVPAAGGEGELDIVIREKPLRAKRVGIPFYSRKYRNGRIQSREKR